MDTKTSQGQNIRQWRFVWSGAGEGGSSERYKFGGGLRVYNAGHVRGYHIRKTR